MPQHAVAELRDSEHPVLGIVIRRNPVIDSEPYFLACCRYIELNPVRARMVRHPRGYIEAERFRYQIVNGLEASLNRSHTGPQMNMRFATPTLKGRAIARLAALLFVVLPFVPATADAEPASIRCADEYDRQSYFVTYDLQTNHFVFESPIGNLLQGEILVANDERLELGLSAFGGKILLFFDRKNNRMRWPGLPAEELRRGPMNHACATVIERTMLSTFSRPDKIDLDRRRQPVDAFSLRCRGNTVYYFITLDRSTKTVVLETEARRILPGDIKNIAGHDISFTVGHNPSEQFDLVWDEQSRSLTWIGIPNDPARPTKTQECTVMKARSVLELYGRLSH